MRIPWGATNQQHRLQIELISDTQQGPERVKINEMLPPGADEEDRERLIALFNADQGQTCK